VEHGLCYKHRNYCKNSTTLFPVLLQAILFSGVAWSLLCLLSSATTGLQDGRGKLKPRAATPSRAAASVSGVKRNACVCVVALSVRLLFCPVGSAAVFFACSSSAQLSLFFPAAVLVVGATAVFFVCATADALPLQ